MSDLKHSKFEASLAGFHGWSIRHGYTSVEELFLAVCQHSAEVLQEQMALVTRAANARSAGDQDALEEIADAIE